MVNKLGFFTPVSYGTMPKSTSQFLTQKVDSYFFCGGTKAYVIPGYTMDGMDGVRLHKERASVLSTALKVASYFTVIVPLIMFVAKVVLRSMHDYYIVKPQLPPQPKPNKIDVKENIERTFWENQFGNEELHRVLQMFIINSGEHHEICAEFIVDHYIEFTKKDGISSHKKMLVNSVVKQLSINQYQHEEIEVELTSSKLKTYPTLGDGSCGLHALLGKLVNGYYQCDAIQARKDFTDWLRVRFQNHDLPDSIAIVLYDYFLNPNRAPHAMQDIIQEYRKDYESLSFADQDRRQKDFVNAAFDTYLEHVQKVGTYLLQEELAAAAICFHKRVVLHQPGWGNDTSVTNHILNEQGDETVHIWYNGINHYERASLN